MHATTIAKNADYTGDNTDPFFNFTLVEKLGICQTEIGFLTRMTDKLSRIAGSLRTPDLKVKDESIDDTLIDLANYCVILAIYRRSKKELPSLVSQIKL